MISCDRSHARESRDHQSCLYRFRQSHRKQCNNCHLPGHNAAECNSPTKCWNCTEYGHRARVCPNVPVCQKCGRVGHQVRNCPFKGVAHSRLCKRCYKLGHDAEDCTNEKACSNCRSTGHLARECWFEPICNFCNMFGHMVGQCPKLGLSTSDICPKPVRHTSDAGDPIITLCTHCVMPAFYVVSCDKCGGRGHDAWNCPSKKYPVDKRAVYTGGDSSPESALTDGRVPVDYLCINCKLPAFYEIICDKCGGRGHYSLDCPSIKEYVIINRHI